VERVLADINADDGDCVENLGLARAGMRLKRLAIVDAAKRTSRLAAEASTFNLQVIHMGRGIGLLWSMRSVREDKLISCAVAASLLQADGRRCTALQDFDPTMSQMGPKSGSESEICLSSLFIICTLIALRRTM